MKDQMKDKLLKSAEEGCRNSYSPYSGFPVGAAVQADSGKIYSGANVENISFGATVCAERVAILKAISEGEKSICAIAIYAPKVPVAYPCGMCLQVISEFAEGDIPVFLAGNEGVKCLTLSDLLPCPFDKKSF